MGKNNRARRAEKARRRERGRSRRPTAAGGEHAAGNPFVVPGGPSAPPSARERVRGLWVELVHARTRAPQRVPTLVDALGRQPEGLVDEAVEEWFIDRCSQLWPHGWQPAELKRHVRLKTNAGLSRLGELAILAHHDQLGETSVDPRWVAQLERFGQRTTSLRGGWLADWRAREGLSRAECSRSVLELDATMSSVPRLEVLIPPPGASSDAVTIGAPRKRQSDPPTLERIRKLLAKAESTEFEEEAAALTAKAQALMTRHAIDEALVRGTCEGDGPRMIRVPVDPPYADAKSVLLAQVAEANRCQAIYLKGLELCSVVGHADDLAAVELMFTSLLVQAQNALAGASQAQAGRRTKQATFRSSFFVAYARRIGERLSGANEEALVEEGVADALPVLRARTEAVDDAFADIFGATMSSGRIRGAYDPAGHAYGRHAADEAKLDSGALDHSGTR